MSVTRYDPFKYLDDLGQLLNQRYDLSKVETGGWVPTIDITESAHAFNLHCDLPGVKKEDVEISMEHNVLTIKGSRNFEKNSDTDKEHRRERVYGEFYRQFSLPETADGHNIDAKLSDGVLEIVVPKTEKATSRVIEIK